MNELKLSDLCVNYGSHQALAGVSLSLAKGEVLLVAGPNGAGKSTLIQLLLGLIKPARGRIEVDGRKQAVDNAFKRCIGYLPESVAFSENLSGRDVLRFFASARGVQRSRIDVILKRVGLAAAGGRAVRGYSRGMRQRLGLGVAILSEPELLLLDEPTGGLDQEGIAVLASLLIEWRQAGRMAIVSSHDLSLFERKVDRVCLLRQGRVLALNSPAGLRETTPWLPVRVSLRIGSVDDLQQILRGVEALENCTVISANEESLVVDVLPQSLRHLLSVQAGFNGAVQGLRIEEPGLDMVYESLLHKEEVLQC